MKWILVALVILILSPFIVIGVCAAICTGGVMAGFKCYNAGIGYLREQF